MRVGNNTFVIVSVRMPMKAMSPVATMASSSLGSTRSEVGCATSVWALDDIGESERTRLGIGGKAVPSKPFLAWTDFGHIHVARRYG